MLTGSSQVKNSKASLTFGLLTLPRGSPSEAGPVFIQVKEPDKPLGPTLQLDHLRPRLHYAHASFNCKEIEAPSVFTESMCSCYSEPWLNETSDSHPKASKSQKTNLEEVT